MANSVESKPKKPNKIVTKIKEVGSELKKVSWPKFSTVVKQTGAVIAVTLFFTIAVFFIDWAFSALYNLLSQVLN